MRLLLCPRNTTTSTLDDDEQVEDNMETPLITSSNTNTAAAAAMSTTTATNASIELPSLSKPLLIIYGFNGITLAFPMLALTYIVNTRVAMPLSDLSIYGALAFCPFSLKPLYAYLSSSKYHRRHVWISALLLLNGMSTAATALIPSNHDHNHNHNSNAIMLCFVLAFLRGITSAWPEFLLGSTLIDQATAAVTAGVPWDPMTSIPTMPQTNSYDLEQVVARFQSQAATARNLGSLVAHMGVILMVLLYEKLQSHQALSDGLVNIMLMVTGAWNVVGAVVAGACQVGYSPSSQHVLQQESSGLTNHVRDIPSREQPDHEITEDNHPWTEFSTLIRNGKECNNNQLEEELEEELSGRFCCKDRPLRGGDAVFIVGLQVSLILLIVRAPLSSWLQPHPSSNNNSHAHDSTGRVVVVTGVMLTIACTVVVTVALQCLKESTNPKQQLRMQRYRVGVFLVLRHAMPSCSAVMTSFFYSMFQATPWVLQLFSLTDMATITLASWSYGRWLAPHSHGRSFLYILAGTTFFSSVTELLFLTITPHHTKFHNPWLRILLVILVKAVVTFSGEWQFLPDVVLATSSAAASAETTKNTSNDSAEEHSNGVHAPLLSVDHALLRSDSFAEIGPVHTEPIIPQEEPSHQPQLWYGTLISCIDFGGQLGSWMTVPLVTALDITRDNDWARLNVLIGLSSTFGFVTLFFLMLLQPPTKVSA